MKRIQALWVVVAVAAALLIALLYGLRLAVPAQTQVQAADLPAAGSGWPPRFPYIGPLPDAQPTPASSKPLDRSSSSWTMEVCGVGVVTIDAARGPDRVALRPLLLAQDEFANVVLRMRDDPDPLRQAAGLWHLALVRADQAEQPFVRNHSDCDADPACVRSRTAAVARATAPDRLRLARLATTSLDPDVYVSGLAACRHGEEALPELRAACGQLSNLRWSQLDPGNAAPWLALAQEAADRKADVEVIAALQRVLASTTTDHRLRALVPTSLLGSYAMSPPAWLTAQIRAVGVYAAVPMVGYTAARGACDSGRLQDANRRELCRQLAEHFVARDTTFVGLHTGRELGQQLGWDHDRLRALRDELDAFGGVNYMGLDDPMVLSCEAVDRGRAFTSEIVRVGEVPAARAALKASGKSVSQAAAEFRAGRQAQWERVQAGQSTSVPARK
jgi:hypothetical protein